jgi:SagB-type dehydrogenase family enzyme
MNSQNERNHEIKYALEYHEETKHSELSLQMSRHYLDFDNKPRPFKVYLDLPLISLPQDFPIPSRDALECISSIYALKEKSVQSLPVIDIRMLAELLFFSAGITREMKFDTGTYYMRAASATGALYPIELYVICPDIAGLSAGIYHFCPGSFSLVKLRSGDFRRDLAILAGGNNDIMTSPVTIAFTSLAWRNSWKYTARSYRHWFWDSGVIAANLLAVSVSAGLKSSLIMGFVDSAVNNLLLLEDKKEAAIVLASINNNNSDNGINNSSLPTKIIDTNDDDALLSSHSLSYAAAAASFHTVVDGIPKILPLSKGEETQYPQIWRIHEASSLANPQEVKKWFLQGQKSSDNSFCLNQEKRSISTTLEPNELQKDKSIAILSLGDTILSRGSSRKFSHLSISKDHLTAILYASTRGVPLDFKKIDEDSLIDIYLIANSVEGLSSGHYFYDRHTNSLKQLATKKEHVSRSESGYLCLGQQLFSDASVVLFLMTDLNAVLAALGNRGYRASQFEAGIVAGKIYLSSYAQGLGASGSTFFDDAVTETFSPHAKDKSAMIAVGVGIPPYRARPGKILAARLTKNDLLSSM